MTKYLFPREELASTERGHDMVLDEMKNSHALTTKGLNKKLDAREKANVKLWKKAEKVKSSCRTQTVAMKDNKDHSIQCTSQGM